MRIFSNLYYGTKAKSLLNSERLKESLDIISEYGLSNEDVKVFKNGKLTNIYYENLHLFIDETKENQIIKLSIKKADEDWIISDDHSTPENQEHTVYIWCYVKVIDGSMYCNEQYWNGAWDKSVTQNIQKLYTYLYEQTEESQFTEAYKR